MGLLKNYVHICFAILNITEYLHVKNAFQYQLSSDYGDNVRWLAYENYNVVIKIRMLNMALPVMEFQDQGYKIRKIFA